MQQRGILAVTGWILYRWRPAVLPDSTLALAAMSRRLQAWRLSYDRFPMGNGQAPGMATGRGVAGARGSAAGWADRDTGAGSALRTAGFFLAAFFLADFTVGFFLADCLLDGSLDVFGTAPFAPRLSPPPRADFPAELPRATDARDCVGFFFFTLDLRLAAPRTRTFVPAVRRVFFVLAIVLSPVPPLNARRREPC